MLLSLVLAVITWFYVSQETYNTKSDVRVPLTFSVPDNRFILAQTCKEIHLDLRGPAPIMNQLNVDNLAAEVDIALKKPDLPANLEAPHPVVIPLVSLDIRNLPPNIQIDHLYPATVQVTLDEIDRGGRWLTVKENLTGKLKPGLRIHKVYLTPKRILVRGPKSILAQRDDIETLPVPIGDLNVGTYQLERALDTSDPKTGLTDCLKPNRPKIDVQIEVVPELETTIIKKIPIEIHGRPGFSYALLGSTDAKPLKEITEVNIRCPKQLLDDPQVKAFVDLTDVTDPKLTEQTREIQFSAPPQIEILTKPPKIIVQIKAVTAE